MNNKNMLIELSEAFGPSGFEEEIKEIIVNEFKNLNSFTKHEDGIGSAYVIYNFHNGSYNDEAWGVMPM